MNKTDIVKALRNQGVKNADATFDKLVTVLTLTLISGEDIVIRNFGKLQPRTHNAVTRRNPQTGVPVDVPERQSVAFVPSRVLKARLNRARRTS
jgi:nucleoid DNA-binding protein